MKSFIIDSFSGGLSNYESKGIKGSFKFGSGLDIRKKVDSLSCNYALADLGDPITDPIYILVPAPNGIMYGFTTNKIYQIEEDSSTSVVYSGSAISGNPNGAGIGYESSGKYYIYWTISGTLHRKELPGASNWSDVDGTGGFPKTTLGTDSHPMVSVNGDLIIGNSQYLAMVGFDGSYTNNALDLGIGNLISSVIERDGNVIIGIRKNDFTEQGAIFMWDTTSLSWSRKQFLPAEGVYSLVDTEFKLVITDALESGIQTKRLFAADFDSVTPIYTFPIDSSGGLSTGSQLATIDNGIALFGMYDGDSYAEDRSTNGIYSFGRKEKNSAPVVNLEYPLNCDIMFSMKKYASSVYVSYRQPTGVGYNYKTQRVDFNNGTRSTAIYRSLDLKAPPGSPSQVVGWQMIKLLTKPMPAGTSISVRYQVNKNDTWIPAKLHTGSSSFSTTGNTEAVFLAGVEGKFFEFEITLTPNGSATPEVYSAEVFFS